MSDFPPDFAVVHDEQLYRPVCVMPYVRRDGSQSRIVEWLTNCPTCGAEFTVITAMIIRSNKWIRRCDACKAPGRRVKTDRKLFLAQIRGEKP